MPATFDVHLRTLHPMQQRIRDSKAKRKIVRAGRRGGKTVYAADETVERFLDGRRVLYAVPTTDQLTKWWFEVTHALREPIENGLYYVNETEHVILVPGTENRIRGKTAWNAATLRGDYADFLVLDEVQLMAEDTWDEVGAPMLLDNDGDALFIYTPPSIRSRSASKASDKLWFPKFAKEHKDDPTGRWEVFHFSSRQNPFISRTALNEIARDMSRLAIRQEIEAEDIDEAPGALWTRALIEQTRVTEVPDLFRIVVGVDPHASVGETGIVVAGIGYAPRTTEPHGFILDDVTRGGSPTEWATAVIAAYNKWEADIIVGEVNNGGDMVEAVIRNVKGGDKVKYKSVRASRGKYIRAEPYATLYENGRCHNAGYFDELENQMVSYVPGDDSPNNLDAAVWALAELLEKYVGWDDINDLGHVDNYESRWA